MDWNEVKILREEIDNLWRKEERYWGQRSRVKWLKWVDKNSIFFHVTAIQRRSRNRIHRIKDASGQCLEGQDSITKGILQKVLL